MKPITKSYPTFDCDAHITEQPQIWEYLSAKEKEVVRPWYWVEGNQVIVNGTKLVKGQWAGSIGAVSVVESGGPGVTKQMIRMLREMDLTDEQYEYVNYKGAREPGARLADMDVQGIDQVVVIPIMMFNQFPWVENVYAAELIARAYNDWIYDWCSLNPERLFPAACLPLQSPHMAAKEIERSAERGFRVAMVRPVAHQDRYPNLPAFEPVWKTFEETGLVAGMHSLAAAENVWHLSRTGRQWSPGMLIEKAVREEQMGGPSQSIGFVHESMAWISNVLLSGFLERYPRLKMAIMESNAAWLPMLLQACDDGFHLYKNQRKPQVSRLPSEIFNERCFIAFEGDEKPVYKQYAVYQDIGIWSSDVYHHDGADAWTAIRYMETAGVPEEVQAKLMGSNARRMYGIKPKQFTTTEPEGYPRPDWYPTAEDIQRTFGDRMTAV
jgi:predicted TIM-barrel fold metal-dependent hydrolase